MSSNSLITEEIAEWKKTKPKTVQFVTGTTRFLTFKYERTPYVKAKVILNFPDDYPAKHIIVTIEGAELAPGLIKKLIRETEQVAKSNIDGKQVKPVTTYLIDFLDTNRFVPCWKEMRKLVDMAKQSQDPKSSSTVETTFSVVSLNEAKGLIRLKMTQGGYFYECKLEINPGYPSTTNLDDPLKLQLVKTNFPKQIVEDVLAKQVKGFVRNMQDGIPLKEAWSRSNPVVNSKEQQSYNDDVGEPIPSLLPLVSLLQTELMQLPKTQCPVCQTIVLPSQPKQLTALYENKKRGNKQEQPVYSSCGCWFHYKCLDKFLSEPPFGETPCPGTCGGQRAFHPDWSTDPQERQRAYEQRQAQQRQLDDVAMLF